MIGINRIPPQKGCAAGRTFSRLGNKQEAAKYQQKAIELAIQDEADKEDIEAFRKTLATYR